MAKPNYAQLWAVSQSGNFLERTSVAVAKYAQYLLGTDPTIIQANWAKGAIQNPRAVANTLSVAIAWNPAISDIDPWAGQTSFDNLADSVVQAAVETVINNTVLTF